MYNEVYRYKVFKDNLIVEGYINASCMKDALKIIKYISFKQIFICKSHNFFHKRKLDQISEWFFTLVTLLNEGVKIESCLEIIKQNPKYAFSGAILDLIKSGFPFSVAIKRHAFFFGSLCVKTVDSVSKFMSIEEICLFLHNYYSKLGSRVNNAKKIIIQPIITLCISFLVMSFAIFFLKTNTENLFYELEVEKPAIFKLIDKINFSILLLIVSFSLIFLLNLRFFLLKIPFISRYYENLDIFISFYCISKALESGIKIIDAIDISIESVETKMILMRLKSLKNSIFSGKSMYISFKNQNFDVEFCEIMRVGEKAGRLKESFLSASSIAETRLSRQFEMLSNILPYLFLSFTSIMVIVFFILVFIPIYSSINRCFF